MSNGIERCIIEEGNLKAIKDTGDFGGPNMWTLYIKDTDGCFRDVQWAPLSNTQPFFKQKLPRYDEIFGKQYKKV